MPILTLNSQSYAGYEGVANEGLLSHGFFARLRLNPESQETTQCYVKAYPATKTEIISKTKVVRENKSLINEIYGYILSELAGHPVPDAAGLIELTKDQLPSPPVWINQKKWLCWFSVKVNSPSINLYYARGGKLKEQDLERVIKELKSSKQAPSLIVLDEWIDNIDRNGGNLIRTQKGRYVLIDHGEIFAGSSWIPSSLNSTAINISNKIKSAIGDDICNELPFKNSRMEHFKEINEKIESSEFNSFTLWVDNTFGKGTTEAKQIIAYITERACINQARKQIGLVI